MIAPIMLEKVPFGHAEQDGIPATSEYVPAEQGWQKRDELEPATDVVPTGHDWQTVDVVAPMAVEYAPAGHN